MRGRHLVALALLGSFVGASAGCSDGILMGSGHCGDGTCSGGESCTTCSQDCGACVGSCGDGTCSAGESCGSCPFDCGTCPASCGNGRCEQGEDCLTCASDCGACPSFCGDKTCSSPESCGTCPFDCGECPASCGDKVCAPSEDCSSCPADCGACAATCGDSKCEAGKEDCKSCAKDCGACPEVCGDKTCSVSETCQTCPGDCGACPAFCGDKTCNATETCESCPTDCGACPAVCGDKTCDPTETCASCPTDCGACGGGDSGVPPEPDQGVPPKPDQGGSTWTGYFPPQSVWYTDYSSAPLHPNSAAIISWLSGAGGWGTGVMKIDFTIEVLEADASTPMKSFTQTGDFYDPDCDFVPMPVPAGGALEGESGYECVNDGDCHLIVVHKTQQKLYEMWRANVTGGTFYGGCLAVWDMTKVYGPKARGEGCTSADAAGFPIAPLLFSADEVKAGAINHAIRFILPNERIRKNIYVRPATHSTPATSGGANAPQYGVHLRLKASTNISGLTPGAKVVAQALMKYGMFLADGGNIALTARSDRFTTAKWSGLLGAADLTALKVTDFEVVDHGSDITFTGDCQREP